MLKIDFEFFRNREKEYNEANRRYLNLTSNKFSREEPSNPATVKAYLQRCCPTFVGLWGGSKESKTGEADEADVKTLDFLTNTFLHSELREITIGGDVVHQRSEPSLRTYLIFCDLHHMYANAIKPEQSERYFNTLKPIVDSAPQKFEDDHKLEFFNEEKSIECSHISYNLIKLSGILDEFLGYDILEDPIYRQAMIKTEELFKHEAFMTDISSKTLKHCMLEKSYDLEYAAKFYVEFEIYFLNVLKNYSTKRLGGLDFTKGIFFSYSDPKIQKPIAEAADVPMLYFHSSGKGHHECPWYS